MNDRELLQAFARQKSETAFAELVRRHGKLVYSCARQRVGDSHAAEDITQSVFLALAIQAAKLPADAVLPGWLYRVTQFTAAKHQRREHNRREREMRASEHQQIHGTTDDTTALWEEIRPHVTSALDELSTTDRNAVLLRFYEQSSYRQVAEALQVSEEAAKKRVNRALERLRRFFTKKGIGIGTGALATVLGARATEAIPATLVSQTVQTAVAGVTGAMAATETLMLAKGAIHMMFIAKLKTAALIAATCVVVAGTGVVLAKQLAVSAPPTTAVAAGPVTTPSRTSAGSPAGDLGAQPTPAKPVEPVQTAVPAMGIQRAPSSGPSLAQLIQRADWIVTGTVTTHVKVDNLKPKPATFKIKVDEVVLQPKSPLPAEVEVKPHIPAALRAKTIGVQPPSGSLNRDINNTWQEPPAVGALVVVLGSAAGCNWAEFANAADRETFVQRLRGYLDGSIHKQLAVELLQPAPAGVLTDYTRPHPAIALNDLEVLGQPGNGPAVVQYAKQFEREQQGKEFPGHFFNLGWANQIVSTLVAVGDQGDDAARQFAAELVMRDKGFASTAADMRLWAGLGRWKRTDVAPKALEILRKYFRSTMLEDASREYFPALHKVAPEEYNKIRTQVTDPKLGQRLDELVAGAKR